MAAVSTVTLIAAFGWFATALRNRQRQAMSAEFTRQWVQYLRDDLASSVHT